MRTLAAIVVFCAWACTTLSASAASAPPLSFRVDVGYQGWYRDNASWVPVRVTAQNRGSTTLVGTVEASGAAPSPAGARYDAQLLLPPGTHKQLTLYVPAAQIQGRVNVAYRVGGRTLAAESLYPSPFGDTTFVIGAVSDDATSVWWLNRVAPAGTSARTMPLSAATLDTAPDALDTFDAIVLSNVDSSRLDQDQVTGLEEYVRRGGSLILVGGPNWQETLSGLPGVLIPGRVSATRTLTHLAGLSTLGATPPPRPVTVSVLSNAKGAVTASAGGLPLVVQSTLGDGQIEYLAFDPGDVPFLGWHRAGPLLTRLVAGAAPLSMRRVALQPVDRSSTYLNPGSQAFDISAELANSPNPGLPMILATLATIVVILAAAATAALLVRALHRPVLLSITVLLLAGMVFQLFRVATPTLARRAAVVNTISVVTLDGSGPLYPANRYVSLFAPLSGDYHLGYAAPALGSPVVPTGFTPPPVPEARFSEGAGTTVTLPGMAGWSTRAFMLRTAVNVPGKIGVRLHLTQAGQLVGTVTNRTRMQLRRVTIIAGMSYARLGDIQVGATARVTMRPRDDVLDHEYPQMLFRVYGQSTPNFPALSSAGPSALLGGPNGLPPEQTLDERIRNAVSSLPESRLLSVLGEVTLVAWTDTPLAPFSVDGAAPQERDISMLVKPLSVALNRGNFDLPTGVFGARPVDVVPVPPRYECCGGTVQPISFGPRGSAIFAFALPAPGRIHFRSLDFYGYAGGVDPSYSAYPGLIPGTAFAFDWQSHRWLPLDFTAGRSHVLRPNRIVSRTGIILLRLRATKASSDLTVLDAGQDLQIGGTGSVR